MTGVRWRLWLVDIVAGGVIGGITGVIVAWNIASWLGVPTGYEASVGDVFEHSVLVGVLWLAALISGPVVGVIVARKQRHRRGARGRDKVGTR